MADGILNPIEQLEADFDFDVYTKQEVDALLDEKADKSDTYTKTETDALLDEKADADAVYTKTETDTLLSAKADKSTTLAGYGITDAYTKTQTDNLLNGKADADSVYTKTEINTKIPNTVGSATKPTYVNGGVITECTYELNKTVPANAVFTDTTYSAGNGLNLSGTSFSAKAGVNVSVDGNGINVNGNGAVASADSGLVSGGTAYTELRPTLDGTWVKNAQTTATNLQKLEGGIEYLYGLLSHQYDQLKKYINGNYYDYDTDTDSKYTKSVPQGAMPYASLDSIGGKALVWNQLVQDPNMTDATKWSTDTIPANFSFSVSSNTLKVERLAGTNNFVLVSQPNTTKRTANHKFLYSFTLRGDVARSIRFYYGSGTDTISATTTFEHYSGICTPTTSGGDIGISVLASQMDVGGYIEVQNYCIFDLTLMYGAGNEPTTVEEFTAQFPADYYAFTQGTLLSAGVTSVISKKADTTEIATTPIPDEIQALEGYGWSAGSVYNYIDYERKVFVQRVASVDLGSLSWTYSYNRFSADVPNMNTSTTTRLDGLTCIYPIDTNSYIDENMSDKTCKRYAGKVLIKDSAYTTTSAFTSAMNGVYLYYELATPIETDISAYITDDNLISVEAGGSLTFPNQHGDDYRIDVPSSETYMVDLQSALGE